MQTGATEKTGARPTSRQLPGWNDGAWDTPFGDANLPFSRGSLMQRRMGGLGGPSAIMVTFAAVIAAAVTYLMLRCALYLASARSSRGELRYLAGSEGRTDKGLGEPCGGPAEDPPAATAVAEEEEEVLVEEDLLKQARRYAVELRLLIDRSEPLLRQLESRLRAKCIAAFLCLSLVELSASFSLLERRERVGMNEEIAHISSRISSLRESLGKKQLSRPRHRHIKCLRELLTMLTEVKPAAAALAPRHRLEAIKMLLQLQDVTLVQLNAALVWLRVSLTNSKSANDDAKGAADAAAEGTALFAEDAASAAAEGTASFAEDAAGAAAEGTASFAEGAVSFAEGAVSFVEGAASFAEGAASFAEGVASFAEGVASAADDYAPTAEDVAVAADLRVAAVVQAIEATVYERRTQVLRDPLLSGWLRDTHAVYTRYGIISHGRMEEIAQQPLTTHRELLEALQNSPLGWGDEPWKYIHIEHRDAQQTTTSSVPGTRLRKQIVSSSEDLNSAARLLGPLKASRQGPRRGAGATGRAPASAPLSTSTVTAAAVAEHAALQASSRGMVSSFRAASKLLFQVPLPSAAGRLQGPAVPSAPKPAAAFSAWNRSLQGTRVSKAVSATSVSRAVGYSPSADAPPRRPPSPSRPAVSTAAPNIPENYGMFKSDAATRGPIASAAPAASWASAVAHGPSPGSAASQLSLAAPAQPPAGLHPAPGASGPCLEDPFPPLPRRHVTPARFPFLASTARDWPLQPIGAGGSPLRQTGKHMSEPAASVLEAVASQPVPVSPFTQAESHSSSETSNPRIPVDIYGVPISFGVWGLPERGLRKPVAGLLPSEEDDQRRPPSPATIAAGFEQLAALFIGRQPQRFSGTAHQQPGEPMQRRQPPVAAPTPTAGAAALAAAAHSSPASVGPDEGSWSPWGYRLEGSFWPFSRP